MKNALKHIYTLFVSLGLLIIVADCGVFNSAFSHVHNNSSRVSTDLTNHFEHSHSASCKDDIFSNEQNKAFKSYSDIQVIPFINLSFRNSFSTSVWQPPKKS